MKDFLPHCTYFSYFSQRHEPNYAATLASIIIIFIVCHMPRLLKTIYEIVFIKLLKNSECKGMITPAKCMPQIINLVLVINASSGFIVYCFVGTFGEKFLEVLTSRCRRIPLAVAGETVELQNQLQPTHTQGDFLR